MGTNAHTHPFGWLLFLLIPGRINTLLQCNVKRAKYAKLPHEGTSYCHFNIVQKSKVFLPPLFLKEAANFPSPSSLSQLYAFRFSRLEMLTFINQALLQRLVMP